MLFSKKIEEFFSKDRQIAPEEIEDPLFGKKPRKKFKKDNNFNNHEDLPIGGELIRRKSENNENNKITD